MLDAEEGGYEQQEMKNEGRESDLRRCDRNLTWLSRRFAWQENGSSEGLDFMELFSPPRVSPIAQQGFEWTSPSPMTS